MEALECQEMVEALQTTRERAFGIQRDLHVETRRGGPALVGAVRDVGGMVVVVVVVVVERTSTTCTTFFMLASAVGRSQMSTEAPWLASLVAAARPKPDAAPVTIATVPVSDIWWQRFLNGAHT